MKKIILLFLVFAFMIFNFVTAQLEIITDGNDRVINLIPSELPGFNNNTCSVNFSEYADIWITNEGDMDNVVDLEPTLDGRYGQLASYNEWTAINNFTGRIDTDELTIYNSNLTFRVGSNLVTWLAAPGFPLDIVVRWPISSSTIATQDLFNVFTDTNDFYGITSFYNNILLYQNFSQTGALFESSATTATFSGNSLEIGNELCHDNDPNTCAIIYLPDKITGKVGGDIVYQYDEAATDVADLVPSSGWLTHLGATDGSGFVNITSREVTIPSVPVRSISNDLFVCAYANGTLYKNETGCSTISQTKKTISISPFSSGGVLTKNGFPFSSLGNSGSQPYSFYIPSDFNSIVNATILIFGDVDGAKQYDLDISVAGVGQNYTTYYNNTLDIAFNTQTDILYEVDITRYFSNGAAANKWVGVNFMSDTASILVGVMRFEYI